MHFVVISHIFAVMNNYDISSLHILTLNTGYAEHDKDWNWKDVRSPFARLYYVTKGEAWVEIDKQQIYLVPNHLYMIPPYTRHSNICTGVFCHYYIHIYENPDSFSFLEDLRYPFEVIAHEEDKNLFQRLCSINPAMRLPESDPLSYDNHSTLLQNIANNNQRPFWDIVESRGIIFIILSRFLKEAQPKQKIRDERIRHAAAYIHEHITEPINISKLASNAYMSEDHFIRLFRKELGETPTNYIIRLKMERAELMLITTNLSVKSISFELGYEEVSYFSNLFKKKIGRTPNDYRKGKRS